MQYSRRIRYAVYIAMILSGPLGAAEPAAQATPAAPATSAAPAAQWTEGAPAYSPQDLYDTETPSNLESCNVSVWRTRPPQIQFTLDLLVMDRGISNNPLLIDANTGRVLLGTSGLIKSAEPGIRAGVILLDDCGHDVEFSYLGLDTFEHSVTRSINDPIVFAFFGGVPANPRQSYTAEYRSEINSGELNIRGRIAPQVSWLAGFRFIELRERFNITSSQGGFFSNTDNDLYGFQLGGDVQLFRVRRSLVFSTLKAGIYYDNADVAASADSPGGLVGFIDDEDVAAFVGDVALGMLIPMGPSADLRLGYQGLFLDGVGLAPDQSDNFSLFTSSGSLDQSSLFYHGGFIGVDLFW